MPVFSSKLLVKLNFASRFFSENCGVKNSHENPTIFHKFFCVVHGESKKLMARACFSNEFLFIAGLLGICELSYIKLLRQVDFNFFHERLNLHFARSVFDQIKHFSFKYFHFSLDECSASFF